MKYVKTYKGYYHIDEEKVYDVTKTSKILDALIGSIFSVFKSKEDVEDIFEKSDVLKKSLDIYDFFTDVKSLIALNEKDLKEFAYNLDVDFNDDVVIGIIVKTYKEKFGNEVEDDMTECISHLNEQIKSLDQNTDQYKSSKIYIDGLTQFLQLVKK